MKIWSLTYEKVEQLKSLLSQKEEELVVLDATKPEQMWEHDLVEVENGLDAMDQLMAADAKDEKKVRDAAQLKGPGKRQPKKKQPAKPRQPKKTKASALSAPSEVITVGDVDMLANALQTNMNVSPVKKNTSNSKSSLESSDLDEDENDFFTAMPAKKTKKPAAAATKKKAAPKKMTAKQKKAMELEAKEKAELEAKEKAVAADRAERVKATVAALKAAEAERVASSDGESDEESDEEVEVVPKKRPAKRLLKGSKPSSAKSAVPFSPAKAVSPVKKKVRGQSRVVVESSDESEDELIDSDASDEESLSPVKPRTPKPSRARKAVVYAVESDDSDEEMSEPEESDSESDFEE